MTSFLQESKMSINGSYSLTLLDVMLLYCCFITSFKIMQKVDWSFDMGVSVSDITNSTDKLYRHVFSFVSVASGPNMTLSRKVQSSYP